MVSIKVQVASRTIEGSREIMVGARTALVVGIDLDPSPSLPKPDI